MLEYILLCFLSFVGGGEWKQRGRENGEEEEKESDGGGGGEWKRERREG